MEIVVVAVIFNPPDGNTGEVAVAFVPSVVNRIVAPGGVEVKCRVVSVSKIVPEVGFAVKVGVRLNFHPTIRLLINPERVATACKNAVFVNIIPVIGL